MAHTFLPEGTDTTMFKTFTSFGDLCNKVKGYRIYIRLSNDWFCTVHKTDLMETARSLKKNKGYFAGDIAYMGGGIKHVQVTLK